MRKAVFTRSGAAGAELADVLLSTTRLGMIWDIRSALGIWAMPTGSGERTLTGRIAPLNGTIGRSLRKSGRSPPIRYASGSLVPGIYIHRIDAPKMPSNWLRLWGLLFEQNREEWGEACVVHGVGNSGGASQAEGLRLTTGLAVADPTSRALSGEARDGLPGRGGLRRYEPGGAVGRGVSMVVSVARRKPSCQPWREALGLDAGTTALYFLSDASRYGKRPVDQRRPRRFAA